MIDWAFWIAIWWGIWFAIFLTWYSRQMLDGKKEPMSATEAFIVFLLSGLGPILAIAIIIGKALARNND